MVRRKVKVAGQRLKRGQAGVRRVKATLPPLEPGDCLIRVEFERRYEARPDLKKAEIIDGVVYMPSPRKDIHARWDGLVAGWLLVYASRTPGTAARSNASVRLDELSEPQPDLVEGRYTLMGAGEKILRSRTFPGLWLDAAAALFGDDARVIKTLERGLATPEHAAFVRRLALARRRR